MALRYLNSQLTLNLMTSDAMEGVGAFATTKAELKRSMSMERILIAGRGEFARRLIRHYKSNGIETVSVFSEPDCEQPWVDEAITRCTLMGPRSLKHIWTCT